MVGLKSRGLTLMPNPEDYSPLPAPPTPVTPPTLPPDFPEVPQNPASKLQPASDSSATADKVAGTMPVPVKSEDDDRDDALGALRQLEQ
jgi:hypothetical protein